MGQIEELAEEYDRHISAPWVRNLAGAQKVIFVVYDKADERRLRAKKEAFQNATRQSRHDWREFDFTDIFPKWMASDEYRESYFEVPEDLAIKASPGSENAEFTLFASECLRKALTEEGVDENTVVGAFGAGSLLGVTRLSHVLKKVEADIRGRLVVFFPGTYDQNQYRLLDARDGWNYLAVPITLHHGGIDR
ncbi:MAG: DUF1788 domain-containing protein [Planctomycetes bacterium]|nr:DUF1788 domain-containing protein [Planctomycetota bacterium]